MIQLEGAGLWQFVASDRFLIGSEAFVLTIPFKTKTFFVLVYILELLFFIDLMYPWLKGIIIQNNVFHIGLFNLEYLP